MDCVADIPAASDVALVASRTQPHEQVAIVFDLHDWAYLLAAHRPPLMFFLPSADIFTREQLEESLRRINNADYLFVPKGANGEPEIWLADFSAVITPLLGTTFRKRRRRRTSGGLEAGDRARQQRDPMMRLFLAGLALLLLAFFVHIVAWRVRLPRRSIRALLCIFAATPLMVVPIYFAVEPLPAFTDASDAVRITALLRVMRTRLCRPLFGD